MNTKTLLVSVFFAFSLSAFAAEQSAAPATGTTAANPTATPATPAATGNATPAPAAAARGQRANRPAPNTTMGLPPTIAPDAKVEKIATLPTESYTIGQPFTEGATCAPNGDVYFVEQNSDKIMKWDVAKKELTVFMHPSGYSNGMCFDNSGNLIACADERNELWSISLTATETVPYPQPLNPAVGDKPQAGNITRPAHTVLVKEYQGKLLNAPNDVWVRPDGGMYMTDPFYARRWWEQGRQQPQDTRGVYFLSPDHKTLTRVINDFNTPNGIVGTPDGKNLFVADINAGQTWGYDIQPDGSLANKRLVCNFGSDGMTIDDKGNLYLSMGAGRTGAGVTVVDSKSGQQIGFIPVPEQPANMCFGGKDRGTLYMTARTGFYSIPTLVKGGNKAK